MLVKPYDSIFVIGATASGKTQLAVQLAASLNGEVISADSRQVYKQMNIGTGKDLNEFCLDGKHIQYHLIDICVPGEKYNIERFFKDASWVVESLKKRQKLPIICGGSGLYIETLLKGNEFASIPQNESLRNNLTQKSKAVLLDLFEQIPLALKHKLDNSSIKKCLRSIEINAFVQQNGIPEGRKIDLSPLIVAPKWSREERRERISLRLKQRFNEGMVEEVEQLLSQGVASDDLKFYGLEYLWITRYCCGEITFDEMFNKLEIAIHQFSKRQMTWFRRMEKQGYKIHWLHPKTALQETILLFD